jgi:hypothetical protein
MLRACATPPGAQQGENLSPTLSCCCAHGLQVLCKLHGPDARKTGQNPPPFPPSVSAPGNWPPWKQDAAAAASTAASCGLQSGLQQHDGHKTQPPQPPQSRAPPIDLTSEDDEVIFEREELAPKGEEKVYEERPKSHTPVRASIKPYCTPGPHAGTLSPSLCLQMRFDRLSRILANPRCRDVPAGPSRQGARAARTVRVRACARAGTCTRALTLHACNRPRCNADL